MARRRVTYQEAPDERLTRGSAAGVLDLHVDPPTARPSWAGEPGAAPVRTPPAPPRRRRMSWPIGAVALLAAVTVVGLVLPDGTEPAATPEPPVTHAVAVRTDPLIIATSSVLPEPWGGVFEHHPDARAGVSVPRVHLVALEGDGVRALLVVDATRRAFGGAAHASVDESGVRVLGARGARQVRTLQWDAGGYGLSLTSVGLTLGAQQAVAAAVLLPPGPSLNHGRPPGLAEEVLSGYGLRITERRSAPATTFGSPMIGQSGGASIEGQLHHAGTTPVLVSVVEDQLVTASRVKRALGDAVTLDASPLAGISSAAVLDHGAAPTVGSRTRGWSRLVLDHEVGVTIELSSDVLGPVQLSALAREMDLDRLARTTSPRTGG